MSDDVRNSPAHQVLSTAPVGFVTVAQGRRHINVFKLRDGWRALSINEAMALADRARVEPSERSNERKPPAPPRRGRPPKRLARPPGMTEREHRRMHSKERPTPSLPRLRCLEEPFPDA